MKKNIKLLTALFGFMVLNNASYALNGNNEAVQEERAVVNECTDLIVYQQPFTLEEMIACANATLRPNELYIPNLTPEREAKIKNELDTIANRSSLKDSPYDYPLYSDFLIEFIESDRMFFQQSNADNLFMSSNVVSSLMLLFKENEEGHFCDFYDILTITSRKAERYASQNENEYNSYNNLKDRFKENFAVIANYPAAHIAIFKKPLTNGEYYNRSQQIKNMNYDECKIVYSAYMLSITKCFKLLFLIQGIQLPHQSSISDMITLLEDNWGEIESFAFNGNTSNWITRLKTNLIIQDNPKLLDRLVNYSRNLLHCMYSILINLEDKYPKENDENFINRMKEIMLQNLKETQYLSINRFNMNENFDENFFINHFRSHNEYIDLLEYINQININAPAAEEVVENAKILR